MAGILLNRSRQVPAEETPAFGGIAERFRRAGDLDRAIALCRDGLKRFPEQLSARVTLGWSLLDKGQYDAARAELEQVLRKAPDNLAAIRGLAELHDRTEGAMPSEDERSWKTDDVATEAPAPMAAGPAAPAAAAPAPDRRAPIPVSLGGTTTEVLHTAAHAEKQAAEAAASDFEPAAGLSVGPVELEDPAAASMAAAEPSPFFVVAPAETLTFDPGADVVAPMPFEVAGVESVQVELETPGAAALSAVDLTTTLEAGFVVEPSVLETNQPAIADVHVEEGEIDWAGLASLTDEAPVDMTSAWDAPRTESADEAATLLALGGTDSGPLTEAAFGASDLLGASAETVSFSHIESEPTAMFAAPEGLDDIDAVAGQELADAIKALEEATKRVEARLAPGPYRNEPATSPEEIAAYDFGPDPGAADDLSPLALLDTRQDGSFELLSPDLADVSFGLDSSRNEAGTDEFSKDWVADSVSAEAVAPSFDFDAVSADVLDEAEATAAAIDAARDADEQLDAPSLEFLADVASAEAFDGIADANATVTSSSPETDVDVRESEVVSALDAAADEAESAGLVAAVDAEAAEQAAQLDVVAERVEAEEPSELLALETFASHAEVAEIVGTDVPDGGQVAEPGGEAEETDEVAAVAIAGEARASEVSEVPEVPEVADISELSEIALLPELVEFDEPAQLDDVEHSADAGAAGGDSELAGTEPEAQAPALDTAPEVRAEVDVEADFDAALVNDDADVAEPTADAREDELPVAAMVATEQPEPTFGGFDAVEAALIATPPSVPDLAAAAAVAPDVSTAAETVPVTHVFDSPVISASAAVAALVGSQDVPTLMPAVGQVHTPVRSPLAALERFLRKVQARRLELGGETVA